MAGPRVNRDPLPATGLAIGQETLRWHRRSEQPGVVKEEGNRARAIVAAIVKRAVAAAPDIRSPGQKIRRPDPMLHIVRRLRGRRGKTPFHPRTAARDRRPARRRRFPARTHRREGREKQEQSEEKKRDGEPHGAWVVRDSVRRGKKNQPPRDAPKRAAYF